MNWNSDNWGIALGWAPAIALTSLLFTLAGDAAAQVRGSTVLTLSTAPDVNILTVTLSSGPFEDTDTSTLSGTVDAILTIDPALDQVSELTFTGADVGATDMHFQIGGGLIADVMTNNLGAALRTPIPPGEVTPETGEFDASQHEVSINRGTASGTSIAGDINEDFSRTPVSGVGSGTGTVTLVRTATGPNRVTYDVVANVPLEFTATLQDGSINVDISGTIRLEGSIEVIPDPYLAWTEENGIPGAPFDGDENRDGVPNGLLWALGYDAADRPVVFLPDFFFGDRLDMRIEPAPGGTAAPIFVEESTSLMQADWTLVEAFQVHLGQNPLPAGSFGPIFVTLSEGPQRFGRLRAQAPE